jgi:hypothetical protein
VEEKNNANWGLEKKMGVLIGRGQKRSDLYLASDNACQG